MLSSIRVEMPEPVVFNLPAANMLLFYVRAEPRCISIIISSIPMTMYSTIQYVVI